MLLFVAFGVLMTGLDGFRNIELVLAPAVGAVAVEAVRRIGPLLLTVTVASVAMWSTYFVVLALTEGVTWTVELWSGSIVLAAASSAALVASHRGPPAPSVA